MPGYLIANPHGSGPHDTVVNAVVIVCKTVVWVAVVVDVTLCEVVVIPETVVKVMDV
jgi:hypothetical protein